MKFNALSTLIPLSIAGLTGCLATTNLLNDPNLDHNSKLVAMTIAEKAKQICITYRFEQGSERRLSGNMRIAKTPEVKRLYSSNFGWWKTELMVSGVWDNVYYLEETQTLICGEKLWQKFPVPAGLVFKEIKPELGLNRQLNQEFSSKTLNTKNSKKEFMLSLFWEGYSDYLLGVLMIDPTKRKGEITVRLKVGEGSCSGFYEMTQEYKGVWSLTCSNGLASSGSLNSTQNVSGSNGEGFDLSRRKVTFTVGEVL